MSTTFQVLEGLPSQPHDDWNILYSSLTDDPSYIQEIYVRRVNWDSEYHEKLYPEGRETMRRVMRKTPPNQDYKARFAARTDFVLFFPDGRGYQYYDWAYPELINGFVHYYESESDAFKDKRSKCSASKFLRTVCRAAEYCVAQILEEHGISYAADFELRFARTEEEIMHVYANGPRSCMSGSDSVTQHQVKIYAQGVSAVAYLVRKEENSDELEIVGRTVVNTETKKWVRLYGATDQLSHLLRKEGYEHSGDAMDGWVFQLELNEHNNEKYGMPYFDFNIWALNQTPGKPGEYTVQARRPYTSY